MSATWPTSRGSTRCRDLYARWLTTPASSDHEITIHHYRDKDQYEVDLVLEREDGAIVGIEVKAAATVTEQDFRGLHRLAAACGSRLKLGLVLYDGELTVPFGKGLFAAPISALWG